MLEKNLSHTFEVSLPFSGSTAEEIVLNNEKFKTYEKIHAVYNANLEIESFSGELIKK